MTAPRNPFAFPRPITLDSLGDLFAHHRGNLGGWRMEEPPADPPAPPAPPADPPRGYTPPQTQADPPRGYTPPQTQADLDRIISDRVARERQKYADYADIKRKAEAHDATLAAQMSEAEKAIAAARQEGESAATQAANARLVKAEARALAAGANFRDPSDAVRFLDLGKIEVGDDGEVDAKAIKDQLAELATTKAYLVDDGKRRPKPDDAQGGNRPREGAKLAGLGGSELYDRLHPKKTA